MPLQTAMKPIKPGARWSPIRGIGRRLQPHAASGFDWTVGIAGRQGSLAGGRSQPPARRPSSAQPVCQLAAKPAAGDTSIAGKCLLPRQRRRSAAAAVTAAAAAATASAAVAVPAAAGGSSLAATMAVVVGWLVIAGSFFRSVPQIVRILKNNSVRGLSLTSFTSELICYMVSVAYNITNGYAFSTFGDTAICALQNVAIVALIFRLGTVPRRLQLLIGTGLSAAAWWLFSGACPPRLLTTLQTGSVVLLALGGRVPQILLNLRRGNSGELSMLSCGLSLAGNMARVFTTLTLVKDPIILASAATQAMLNGILTWQCVDTARRFGTTETAEPAVQPS